MGTFIPLSLKFKLRSGHFVCCNTLYFKIEFMKTKNDRIQRVFERKNEWMKKTRQLVLVKCCVFWVKLLQVVVRSLVGPWWRSCWVFLWIWIQPPPPFIVSHFEYLEPWTFTGMFVKSWKSRKVKVLKLHWPWSFSGNGEELWIFKDESSKSDMMKALSSFWSASSRKTS